MRRPEAFEIFWIAAGGDRRERAAVKGALKADDPIPFRMAADELIAARGLDRAFHRLGAGIGEEHQIGKACCGKPRAKPFRLRNLEKIGDVPELLALLGQRLDEMGMGMADADDGNAGAEIEIFLAVRRVEPGALAPLESEIEARIGG